MVHFAKALLPNTVVDLVRRTSLTVLVFSGTTALRCCLEACDYYQNPLKMNHIIKKAIIVRLM